MDERLHRIEHLLLDVCEREVNYLRVIQNQRANVEFYGWFPLLRLPRAVVACSRMRLAIIRVINILGALRDCQELKADWEESRKVSGFSGCDCDRKDSE